MLDVIDVSRWQGIIDWKKVKASGKVGGVMIRAVSTKSGQLYVDPCFEANYAGAKSVGLPVGVYAYTVAVTEGMAKKELNLLKMPAWKERALSCPLLWTWRTPI